MSGIIYTAVDRGTLIATSPAHTAGTPYSIDAKLQAYDTEIQMPKTQHKSLDGGIETVLKSVSDTHGIILIFPDTLIPDIREFLYSVAGGEAFSFDPYGTIAVPDAPFDVKMTNQSVPQIRIQHGQTPWRTVSLALSPV